jgi:hypothetical protein
MAELARRCLACGHPLGVLARRDRVYCSSTCRLRDHRLRRDRVRAAANSDLQRLVDRLEPALAETALVHGVALAARTDVEAAMWLLERRWPERWPALRRERALDARSPLGSAR